MVAAVAAARRGGRVLVLERMRRVGKKLLATGNGRCNLSNENLGIECYHGSNSFFVENVIMHMELTKTRAFFEDLGLPTRVEEEGKIFPLSGQASSVLDVLRYELDRLGVEVRCETNVSEIRKNSPSRKPPKKIKDRKIVPPFTCLCTNGDEHPADAVVIAAGGKSAPNMGSNGGGFKIAEKLGHRLVPPFPALVRIQLQSPHLKRLKGLKIEAEAAISVDGVSLRTEKGEVLFTNFGVSGPPILQLSRIVSEPRRGGAELTLRLDLFPETPQEELEKLITRRIAHAPHKTAEFSFVGLVHKRLIPVFFKEAGIENLQAPCGELSKQTVAAIAKVMKNWTFLCSGVQSWMDSQVTAGGVDTGEVNPETMESKIAPGVFFAGEVLDVDGDSGGYNLQWAWSSGHLAGARAAIKG